MIAAALALALASPPQIAAFGRRASYCETALDAGHLDASFAWVMGYFTGLNTALQAQTGRSTDGEGIMAEVRLLCQREPRLPLIDAAERVYLALQEPGS